MVNLRLLGIHKYIKKPPAPLKKVLCMPFFIFCQAGVNSHHPMGLKTLNARYFFGGWGTDEVKMVLKHTLGVL